MRNLVFLNSHPIQYFAPLYKDIAATTDINLTVWYCSDESIRGEMDKGFGKKVKWDIPLLEGYRYEFLKNYSWKKSISKGFMGLINFGVIKKLYRQPKSVVVIHGWNYATNVMAIIFGRLFGHQVCFRGETPYNQELLKPRFITSVKHLYLRLLFSFVNKFLYIGTQNKKFYESLGINESKLFPIRYCVDNDRFHKLYLSTSKEQARAQLNIAASKRIILYSGKYISKKRPMDLLKAFQQANHQHAQLIFVGDGELRAQMQQFIDEHRLAADVVLTGFINQSEIPLYYRAADVFVMCSGVGETWGLSVNEAMNFALPVIVSDTCGCATDLVENGKNGAVFETGNITQLAGLLTEFLEMPVPKRIEYERASLDKIDQFSYSNVIAQLKKIVV